MAGNRFDSRFITGGRFNTIYEYAPITKNNYNACQRAKEVMEGKISDYPCFDEETNRVNLCTCRPTNTKKKCMLSSRCKNRDSFFDCPEDCPRTEPPDQRIQCMNRDIARENFTGGVEVRACREKLRGLGLFATKEIKKQAYIGEIVGTLGTAGANDLLPNNYCFQFDPEIFINDYFPDILYLDTSVTGNEWRYLNSGCKPNAWLKTVAVGLTLRLVVQASRDIPKDEEITVKYTNIMYYNFERHGCGNPSCPIWFYQNDRELWFRVRQLYFIPHLPPEPLDIQRELLDANSSQEYFNHEGLGPIQGVGIHPAGFRSLGNEPFHIPPPQPDRPAPPPPPPRDPQRRVLRPRPNRLAPPPPPPNRRVLRPRAPRN